MSFAFHSSTLTRHVDFDIFVDQLDHYFRRLRLDKNELLDIPKLMATFIKQGYLVKQKVTASENSRTTDKDPVEYRWGPRSKVEFSESNICEFIKGVCFVFLFYFILTRL